MTGFDDPAFYGARWAGVHDDRYGGLDPAPTVDFLAELADGGRVLELAIGTGRIALPLARRGVIVEGADASEAMLERLRAKPGGDSIPVTVGDMAEVEVSGPFRLVYLVSNSCSVCLVRHARPSASRTWPGCSTRTGCSSSNASSLT